MSLHLPGTAQDLRERTQGKPFSLRERAAEQAAQLTERQRRYGGDDAVIVTDDKEKAILLKPDVEGSGYVLTKDVMKLPGDLLIGGPPSSVHFSNGTQLNNVGLIPSTILTPTASLLIGAEANDLQHFLARLTAL